MGSPSREGSRDAAASAAHASRRKRLHREKTAMCQQRRQHTGPKTTSYIRTEHADAAEERKQHPNASKQEISRDKQPSPIAYRKNAILFGLGCSLFWAYLQPGAKFWRTFDRNNNGMINAPLLHPRNTRAGQELVVQHGNWIP